MIQEISVENYLSINDKVTINLDSSASKKLPQNLIELSENDKLLKTVVIYGANASGKSNIIKSVFFMWNLIKNSHNYNVDIKIPRIPFKLDEKSINEPSKFEIIFIQKNVKYKYGFSCDNDKIIDEYLFYWPNGRESQIFTRTKTNIFDFKIDEKQQELIKLQMTDNVLYLSRATQLGYDKTKEAYTFFINDIVINYTPMWKDFTIRMIHDNPKLKEKIIEILQKTDFGGIVDIQPTKEKKKVTEIEFKFEKGDAIFNPSDTKEEDVYDLKFLHKTNTGKLTQFNLAEESEGTQRTLSLLGPIFDILESGKVAFIDEFEVNLHPNITRFLVKLFHSKYNKNNAQLIFTTHDTTLLDNELFRKDQIYICSKKPNSQTVLNSLSDYDLRESANFEKAYLNGRVGGLPFIDDIFVD